MEGQYPINDIISISDPMCLQRGYALFYKGYLATTNLNSEEIFAISSVLFSHNLHENIMDSAIVQRIYLNNIQENEAKTEKTKILAVLVKYENFILAQTLNVINKPFGQFDPLLIQKSRYCILVFSYKGNPYEIAY